MSVGTAARTARTGLLVIAVLAAALWAAGAVDDDDDCERVVTYEVTWDDPFVRARGVEWGPLDDLKTRSGVKTPWREEDDVPCGTVVVLSAAVPRRVPDFTCRVAVNGITRWEQTDDRLTTCDAQVTA